MQQLLIAGNVGKDAVLRNTQSGDTVLGFSVAVDNGKDASGNKRESTWVDCSIWGKRATALEPYITKGLKVTATGRPTVREHNGKAYLGLSVDQITLQGGGQQRDNSGYDQSPQGGAPAGGYGDMDDSEIPF